MGLGVDTAIEGSDSPGAELGLQVDEGLAAGVGEDEVEVGEAVGGDVGDWLAFMDSVEGDRGIEVIEDVKAAVVFEEGGGGRERIGAVGSYDTDFGVAKIFHHLGASFFPRFIKNDAGARNFLEVAILGIEGEIAFVEDGSVAASDEGAEEASPKRGVAVAPGRGNR